MSRGISNRASTFSNSINYIHQIFPGIGLLWQSNTLLISYFVERRHLQILPLMWKVKCWDLPIQVKFAPRSNYTQWDIGRDHQNFAKGYKCLGFTIQSP